MREILIAAVLTISQFLIPAPSIAANPMEYTMDEANEFVDYRIPPDEYEHIQRHAISDQEVRKLRDEFLGWEYTSDYEYACWSLSGSKTRVVHPIGLCNAFRAVPGLQNVYIYTKVSKYVKPWEGGIRYEDLPAGSRLAYPEGMFGTLVVLVRRTINDKQWYGTPLPADIQHKWDETERFLCERIIAEEGFELLRIKNKFQFFTIDPIVNRNVRYDRDLFNAMPEYANYYRRFTCDKEMIRAIRPDMALD